jgi:hypothetical protein
MGVAFAMSACFGCGRTFTYNPLRVPSITSPSTNTREPICRVCIERVNPIRIANGLDPILPFPDAYDACDESELS